MASRSDAQSSCVCSIRLWLLHSHLGLHTAILTQSLVKLFSSRSPEITRPVASHLHGTKSPSSMEKYTKEQLIELVDAYDTEFTHLQKKYDELEKEKREDTSHWYGECQRRDERIKELEEMVRRQRSRSRKQRSRSRKQRSRSRRRG
eukprot:3989995-Amphidinium_carterae.1